MNPHRDTELDARLADLELDNEGLSRHVALMERHRMGEARFAAGVRRLLAAWDDCTPPADLAGYLAEPLDGLRGLVDASPTEPADDPYPDGLPEDLYTDIESTIHQHCGHDGQSDEANDWVTDLMSALTPLIVRALVDGQPAPTPDPADFYGIHSELPRPPIAMTGERDTDAQDRELSDIYGIDAATPTPGPTREQVAETIKRRIRVWFALHPERLTDAADDAARAVLSLFGSACAPEPPAEDGDRG